MAITFSNLGTTANPDINGASGSIFSNSGWTPPSSGLIVLYVSNTVSGGGTPIAVTPSVSGNGLTWTQIETLNNGSSTRITLFGADASVGALGTTTLDFGTQTQVNVHASFFLASGADESNGVSQSFVQTGTVAVFGGKAGTIDIGASSNSDNRNIVGWRTTPAQNITEKASWSVVDDFNFMETHYRSDAYDGTSITTMSISGDILGISSEIKIAEVSGTGPWNTGMPIGMLLSLTYAGTPIGTNILYTRGLLDVGI